MKRLIAKRASGNHKRPWPEGPSSLLRRHAIYLCAFFIPLLLMLAIFAVRGIFPFGDRSFLRIDMYHQYFPFLRELRNKLASGESLFFSWNVGLGSNFLSLFAYYLSSPANWFCVLVPEDWLLEFQTYMAVVKLGLAGFSSCFYFRHHFRQKTPVLLLFSTCYALSGFTAAYNWNVMWLDVILLAPIVILGLERLVSCGKYRLYFFSLSIAILSNYYLCIMLCIYLALYFFLVLLPGAPLGIAVKLRALRQFFLTSLLAGGMGGVLLLPEAYALSLTEFSGSGFPTEGKSYFAIFDVLSRHMMDVAVETGLDHWPNLYCGVAALVLAPLYILCRTIPSRRKIGKLILLGFFLISFSSNVLSFIWHGFNYPNSLPCRQSYLYLLLALTISLEAFLELRSFSRAELAQAFFAASAFLILAQKLATDDALTNRSFLLTFVFLLGYAFLFLAFRSQTALTAPLLLGALFLVMAETGLNTFLTSCSTVSRTSYLADYGSYGLLTGRTQEKEGGFSRFERDSRVTTNDGTRFGYPSASYFSSTGNGLVNVFYEKYGLRTSKVYYSFDGATPLTRSLLNVPYTISGQAESENPLLTQAGQEGNLYLYEHSGVLPFGYVISASALGISEKTLDGLFVDNGYAREIVLNEGAADNVSSLLPIERQNRLARSLGAAEDLFTGVEEVNTGSAAFFTVPETGFYYGYSLNSQVTSAEMTVRDSAGEVKAEKTFDNLKNSYLLDLGYRQAGESIQVTAEDGIEIRLEIYRFHEGPFNALMESMGENPMELTSFSSSSLSGNVQAGDGGYLILSLPYEPGWTAYLDGEAVEPLLFEGMFMAFPLAEGEHSLSLTFTPQGFYAGLALSLVSLALFALYDGLCKKLSGPAASQDR